MAGWKRTHTCGALRESHIGQAVVLNGWVSTVRAYNAQVFIDLRDRYGVTQVVVDSDRAEAFRAANEVGREFVLAVAGTVAPRLPDMEKRDCVGSVKRPISRCRADQRMINAPIRLRVCRPLMTAIQAAAQSCRLG